ncbi:unnamed protein product [Blepharisma stoltei]|uniref:Uncharacterized protein n=1 Tax=Blepharisma stoltei TaxID=1481888 RepID=A0AAU9IW23_9CILI|nr:unnamed protein product [Blepharisma stoltei]
MLNIFPKRKYLSSENDETQMGSAYVLKRLKTREHFNVNQYFHSSTPQSFLSPDKSRKLSTTLESQPKTAWGSSRLLKTIPAAKVHSPVKLNWAFDTWDFVDGSQPPREKGKRRNKVIVQHLRDMQTFLPPPIIKKKSDIDLQLDKMLSTLDNKRKKTSYLLKTGKQVNSYYKHHRIF